MAYQGGTIKSTSINGVKMYSVSGQRSLATWLTPKKQKALRKDKEYQKRVELIQDLRFETATTKIKATPDGEFLIASGVYPPQVKVYELRELSLKFERHLISEIIDFEVLSEDYSKIAFLYADRSVCLHAKFGSYYSLRIPRMGRDMTYDAWSCDLLCAASSPDLYRINLEQLQLLKNPLDWKLDRDIQEYEQNHICIWSGVTVWQGRFLNSLSTRSPALNVVSRSKLHGLVACGGEDGAVECFDMRIKSPVGRINTISHAGDIDQEVTAIEFDNDGGFLMAVGGSAGKVLIYDLRSSHPIRVKDHMYGSPILDIKWHQSLNSERPKLITTDNHIVRIWDPDTGDGMASIEPTGGTINDVCVFRESGLILLALDSSQIPSYFIPALGPAPKWCSYLENLTEELEEGAEPTIYDDFKFLTKEDLERLNLTNLIGTNLLRGYMHGYFIDYRLYKKAQSLANPTSYLKVREQLKQEKMNKERESRITIKRTLPKVNRKLVANILENDEAEEVAVDDDETDKSKRSKKKKGLSKDILEDDRFKAMFHCEDYQIDESSHEYRLLHPMPSKKPESLLREHFEQVMEEQSDSDVSTSPQSSDDEANGKTKKRRGPTLYEVKDARHAEAYGKGESLAHEDALPLGDRIAAQERDKTTSGVQFFKGGARSITFRPRSSAKYEEDDRGEERGPRRGVQSLHLTPDRSGSRGRGRGGGRGEGVVVGGAGEEVEDETTQTCITLEIVCMLYKLVRPLHIL